MLRSHFFLLSVYASLALAPTAIAQVTPSGGVFLHGATVSTGSGTDSLPPGTAIAPELDLAQSGPNGTSARIHARRLTTGFEVSGRISFVGLSLSSAKGGLWLGWTPSTRVTGKLIVQIRGAVRPNVSMTSSPVGSRDFTGPESDYSIPMTLDPSHVFQRLRVLVDLNLRSNLSSYLTSLDSSVRIWFAPDPPPLPRCTIRPYGRSCASLTGSHDRLFRRIRLRLETDLPRATGQVVIGVRQVELPTLVPGCLQLVDRAPVLFPIMFQTDASGNSTHSIPAPPVGATLFVQDVVQGSRAQLRTSNGLAVSCY